MHELQFKQIERICARRGAGGAVLEVGATPDDSSLLNMKCLEGAKEKIGVNLNGPSKYKDFSIMKCNANSMTCFEDERFDTVLCNSTLEHDKYFWKTISEIKRVTRRGGLIVIGTPGYAVLPKEKKIKGFLKNLFRAKKFEWIPASTLTLHVHNYPGDYYRFSAQAFQEVFFEGMKDVEIVTHMMPPRIIGTGVKP